MNEEDQVRGRAVKRLRERHLWSRRELARRAGISPSAVAPIEEGRVHVQLATIGKLANALGVAPDVLLYPEEYVEDIYPKGLAPTSPTLDKEDEERREELQRPGSVEPGAEDDWARRVARMEDIRDYAVRARIAQERISRELTELKGTNDRRKISELYILATTSVIGMDTLVSEDEDIESIESEAPEELEAERGMWEALLGLAAVVDAVEAELYQVDDAEEVDVTLSAAHKKAAERWIDQKAS